MSFTGLQAQLEQALSEIADKQAQMHQLQQDLRSRTVTARSKDRMLSATVKSAGELSKLEFHDERYRTMAKAELADAIVKVVEQARSQLLSEINEIVRPELGDIARLREQLGSASPWADFLDPLLKKQQEVTNSITGETRSHGNGQ